MGDPRPHLWRVPAASHPTVQKRVPVGACLPRRQDTTSQLDEGAEAVGPPSQSHCSPQTGRGANKRLSPGCRGAVLTWRVEGSLGCGAKPRLAPGWRRSGGQARHGGSRNRWQSCPLPMYLGSGGVWMGWVGDLQPARCPIVPSPRVKVGIWGILRRYQLPLLHGDVGGEGTGWDGGSGRWDRREGWGQRRDLMWPWSRCTAWGGSPCRAVLGSRSHVPALTMFQWHCGKAVLPSLLSLCSCSRQPWVGCHVPRDPCPGAAEP